LRKPEKSTHCTVHLNRGSDVKINFLGKKIPNIYDTFAEEGGPYI